MRRTAKVILEIAWLVIAAILMTLVGSLIMVAILWAAFSITMMMFFDTPPPFLLAVLTMAGTAVAAVAILLIVRRINRVKCPRLSADHSVTRVQHAEATHR